MQVQVHTKMMTLHWIYELSSSGTGIGNFIDVLARAPDSVLLTDFASTLIDDFYEQYFWRIIGLGFVPYVLYFIAAIYQFSG